MSPAEERVMRLITSVVVFTLVLGGAEVALAQQTAARPPGSESAADPKTDPNSDPKPAKAEEKKTEEQVPGFSLPNSDKLRVSISSMSFFGNDPANAAAGFEKGARIGNVIITMAGRLNSRFQYRLAINPVNETAPLPACTEAGFFQPNAPEFLYADGKGPEIGCDPNGNRRVDMYRGIAGDTLGQQGMIREAYLKASLGRGLYAQIGRTILPIGFTPTEAGSWTAKDATMIQRLNHTADFALSIGFDGKAANMRFGGSVHAVAGDSGWWKDYAYNRFFIDGSMDGNSALTAVGSAYVSPIRKLDFRVAYKKGYTGSKIERYAPSPFASAKHNDNSLVLSGQYKLNQYDRVLAECGQYTVGFAATSARMVGLDPTPVRKNGCYFTVEGGVPVHSGVVLGGSYTREEIDRADAMIRYLSEKGMYGILEGKKDRMSVIRVFVDLSQQVRIGYFMNAVSNPYPWVSGIYSVEGPNAFKGRALNRWGLVVNFKLQ